MQKRFKTDVPLRERSIDAIVYSLFGLNAAETALVERVVQR